MRANQAFNARKAAQVVAYFAAKAGGSINVLKVTKLVYLADRRFMEKYDSPILFDSLVSMPHGPVNSRTYNFINGELGPDADWDEFVSDRAKHHVASRKKGLKKTDLDQLSEAEITVLREVWERFKSYDGFALRDYTHKHCPEWEDPDGSSTPIPYSRVLNFLKKANAEGIEDRILLQREVNQALAKFK